MDQAVSLASFQTFQSKVEKGSFFERGATLVLVFLQLYPQYRALRIIAMRFLFYRYQLSKTFPFHLHICRELFWPFFRRKFINSITVELEEELYFTKISYIEPIFEGGLQVSIFLNTLLSLHCSFLFKVAVQLYLIYIMNTKVDNFVIFLQFVLCQDRAFLDFHNLAYDEGDSW